MTPKKKVFENKSLRDNNESTIRKSECLDLPRIRLPQDPPCEGHHILSANIFDLVSCPLALPLLKLGISLLCHVSQIPETSGEKNASVQKQNFRVEALEIVYG